MKTKILLSLILLISLLACNYTTEYIVITATPAATSPTATAIPMLPVVVTMQDIPAGALIQSNMVSIRMMPADSAPNSAFTAVNDVIGLYTVTDLYWEEIILSRQLTDNPEFGSYRNLDPVIVATHPLEVGEVLDESDISASFYNTVDFQVIGMYGFDTDTFIHRRADVLGRSLVQAVGAFQPITSTALSGG